MTTPRKPRTIGTTLASVTTGLVVGCIVFACALAIGLGIGAPFALFGKAGVIMAFVLTCVCMCFVSEALGAAGVARLANVNRTAFVMAMGIVPMFPLVVLRFAEPDWAASITTPCLLIGFFQGLGGLYGCQRAQSRAARFRHGIGTTCAECEYDLTATAQGQPCPECGGMMRLTPQNAETLASSNAPEGA